MLHVRWPEFRLSHSISEPLKMHKIYENKTPGKNIEIIIKTPQSFVYFRFFFLFQQGISVSMLPVSPRYCRYWFFAHKSIVNNEKELLFKSFMWGHHKHSTCQVYAGCSPLTAEGKLIMRTYCLSITSYNMKASIINTDLYFCISLKRYKCPQHNYDKQIYPRKTPLLQHCDKSTITC